MLDVSQEESREGTATTVHDALLTPDPPPKVCGQVHGEAALIPFQSKTFAFHPITDKETFITPSCPLSYPTQT